MSVAYWCVLIAAMLPYFTVAIAKWHGSYDNRRPRAAGAYKGFALRAFNAHMNGFEAFPFFAVAVLVASGASAHVTIGALNILAVLWLVSRLAYIAAYLSDGPNLRSLLWMASLALTVTIFTLPTWHG